VFFLARFGAGISQSSTNSVHGSLLADTYPINVRGRIYAAMGMGQGAGLAASPLLVGLIATEVGGPNGWRWAFYILAIPILCWWRSSPSASRAAPRAVREEGRARRGHQRHTPAAPSLEAAFERVMRIRTIKTVLIAFSAIGFGLFTGPVLGNLYLKQRFGISTPSSAA
jgi:MFS family permease